MARSIFNFESEDRVESPERLNEYVRMASPGTWVMIFALVLVLLAFIVWGFTGTIPETVSFKGVVDASMNYHFDVFVDASQYSGRSLVGKEITFSMPDGISGRGRVVNYSDTPLSRTELAEMLESDFLTDMLVTSDYSYVLEVEPEADLSQYELEVGQVNIIMNEIRPIRFLIR